MQTTRYGTQFEGLLFILKQKYKVSHPNNGYTYNCTPAPTAITETEGMHIARQTNTPPQLSAAHL
jgi:hypothetical protein